MSAIEYVMLVHGLCVIILALLVADLYRKANILKEMCDLLFEMIDEAKDGN